MTPRPPHILLIDDDSDIRRLTSQLLAENGMKVTALPGGVGVARRVAGGGFDLLLLDVMLPGEDGFALCRKIRESSPIPIVMLTARAEETDRVIGLEIGADDYVVKPFAPRELVARIRARLRRSGDGALAGPKPKRSRLFFDGWTVDLIRRELRAPDGALVSLTGAEFDLLVVLAGRAQRVVSRDELTDTLHGRAAHPTDRSIDVAVSRLRRKIEAAPEEPRFIRTVRNGGYVFAAEVTDDSTDASGSAA
ncbi:MAG: response regulator transcription factor [Tagaea sp.]|nr:response regulator transcription factor [Tagaea sp.]